MIGGTMMASPCVLKEVRSIQTNGKIMVKEPMIRMI